MPTIISTSHSDKCLIHRLYFSCGWVLICQQDLYEYADYGDWSSTMLTLSLDSENYVRLEHEASNLHHYSVTRDFDSYWTHERDSAILDNNIKFTIQYSTALEREIQDGLLTTLSA